MLVRTTLLLLLGVGMATLVAAEVPWMARLEEMIQPRARALAESSCHSFSTNEILGALGEQPVLHFCDFPEYRTELCAFTTLRKCCRTMAVTQQLAQPVRFEEIVFDGTTYQVQFFNSLNGVCYVSEPEVSQLCFDCVPPSIFCIDPNNPYCEDGVNYTIPCAEGVCRCREGHTGVDCCTCDEENGFYRNLDTGICETCDCCSENVIDGGTTCDKQGSCGVCMKGYEGNDCCTETKSRPTATTFGTVGITEGISGGACGVPCIVGIVVGIILAILLFLLLLLLIYGLYRYNKNPKTRVEETGAGLGGDARDNPLYLEPATVVGETQ